MNRPNSNRYISFPIGIVKLVGINFLVFLILILLLIDSVNDWNGRWLVGTVVLLLSNLIVIGINYSSVKGDKTKVTVSSLTKSISLNNITEIKAWWCYDLSGSGSYQRRGVDTEMKQSASKINCIVKFSSKSESVYLLEEIHLGDKFPNHLPYLFDEPFDKDRTLVVWDVDNCLTAMGIRLANSLQ